jgi:hypothetical protein
MRLYQPAAERIHTGAMSAPAELLEQGRRQR